MGDEPENKTDKVISMKEFLKEVEKDADLHTVEEMFEYISKFDLKKAVVVGEDENGRMAFFSNIGEFTEILFFIEAYKKMLMDRSFGQY